MTKVLNKKGVKHDLRGSLMALAPAAAIVAMPAASAASATNNDENINGATISITDTGITTGGAYSQTGSGNAFTKIIGKYKIWVMGFLGIGVTTMVIFFIKNFLGLAQSGNNPQKRAEETKAVIIDFIAAAGMGAAAFFVGVGFNTIAAN